MGIRKKRRQMRAILKEGLEAALRANPEVVENCKPRTFAGALVRGMLIEAAKAKTTPLKTVMSLLDWEPEPSEAAEEFLDEVWDWSDDGVWETMPEPEPEPAEATDDAEYDPAKQELKRRLNRLIEAGQHEHAARIMDAVRSGKYRNSTPPPG